MQVRLNYVRIAISKFYSPLKQKNHSLGLSFLGFSLKFIQNLSVDGLKSILQLLVDKGKCLSTLHTPKESVKVYDAALAVRAFFRAFQTFRFFSFKLIVSAIYFFLQIIEKCPASAQMTDRSISFTLFSGLFVLLKFGMIEQDKECTYEQDIVRRFVEETKFHGDPVSSLYA